MTLNDLMTVILRILLTSVAFGDDNCHCVKPVRARHILSATGM